MEKVDWIIKYRKKIWWILLLILNGLYLIKIDIDLIYNMNNFDSAMLITFIVLIFMPLFSEFSFAGMSIKKEIDNVKTEFKSDIQSLKLDMIQLSMSNSLSNDINIDIGNKPLPSVDEIKNNIDKDTKEVNESDIEVMDFPEISKYVSDNNTLLFKVHYTIEQLLNKIITHYEIPSKGSVYKNIKVLHHVGIVDHYLNEKLNNAVSICNRGIHGEIVALEYMTYLRNIYGLIIESLESLLENDPKLNYCICTKCGYRGPSKYENACPNCGFVSDDY